MRHAGRIVLAVASSGIAACLIDGGRTPHSRFKIPLEIHETSVCNIKVNSPLAELIRQTDLILWDEITMCHKYSIEAVSRTMSDICRDEKPFGNKVVVFGGDFKQCAPVIEQGTPGQVIEASFRKSVLWNKVRIMMLTRNMRLEADGGSLEFRKLLIDIGNGNHEGHSIKLPDDIMISPDGNGDIGLLIDYLYSNFDNLEDKVILTPKNVDVQKINEMVSCLLP